MLWSNVDPYFYVQRQELQGEQKPAVIIAGNSYSWTVHTPDYSAATYGLTLHIRGKDVLTVKALPTGSAGTDFGFTLTAPQTANLGAGLSQFSYLITSGSNFAHTLKSGHMPIEANVATMGPNDGVPFQQRALDIIQARLENRLTADMELFMLAGRQITRIPMPELMKLRATMAKELYHLRYGNKNGIPVEINFTRVRY